MLIELNVSELYIFRALLLDQQAVINAHIPEPVRESLVLRLHEAIMNEDPAQLEYPVN